MFRSALVLRNACSRCHVRRQVGRAAFLSSDASASTTASSTPATKAEIESLSAEIKVLQRLIQHTHNQSAAAERLARQVESQSVKIEQELGEIHERVISSSTVERMSTAAMDYVKHNEALVGLAQQIQNHPRVVNQYTVASVIVLLLLIWRYRATIHERTSEEVADLFSGTLEQESLRQTIRETLDAVATSPETLDTLTRLLQRLIQEPSTQQELVHLLVYAVNTKEVQVALLDLLQVVFKDPYLQELTGEFLLKGLDVDHVREMLEAQTQALVRQTVMDESVQRATSTGLQKSLWYAMKPPFLRDRDENNNNNKAEEKQAEEKKQAEERKEAAEKEEALEKELYAEEAELLGVAQ